MKRTMHYWLLLLLAFIFISAPVCPPIQGFADSWTDDVDDDPLLYGNPASSSTEKIEEEKQGCLAKAFTEFLCSIGNGAENMFHMAGISIDKVIYGRVNGNGDKNNVAMFTFELNKGNPYGLTGAAIYQVFRMISYGLISVTVLGKLSFGSFQSMTPQNLEKTKSSLWHLVLSFLLLSLMPYILDLILYLRDVVLYIVSSVSSSMVLGSGSSSFSLNSLFRDSAYNSITGAAVYIASVFYSLYLAFMYVGYAMNFLVCFAVFPIVVVASNLKKDLLSNWVSTVLYFVLIPVIDGGLLLVPAAMLRYKVPALITLLTCMSIVSARSIVAQLIGLQSKGSGIMGMAAMLAGGRMVGSLIHTGKAGLSMAKGANSDEKMAQYEEELAATEKGGSSSSKDNAASPLSASSAGIGSASAAPADTSAAQPVLQENTHVGANMQTNGSTVSKTNSYAADKYADVDNFESGPLSSQISHSKKAELYRQRAALRKKQALGTIAGGAVGAVVGGSAGLMMGPAATAMGAAGGTAAGSALGQVAAAAAVIGNYNRQVSDNIDPAPIEHVSGEVVGDASLPDLYETNASMSVDSSSSAYDSAAQAHMSDVAENLILNRGPITDCATYLNGRYTDNAKELMEPILNEMKADKNVYQMNKERFREEFRSRVHEKYMEEFDLMYDNHADRITSGSNSVEQAARASRAKGIRNNVFSKDNTASFISDEALNNYSWFDM